MRGEKPGRILFILLFFSFLAGTSYPQTFDLQKLNKSQCSLSQILRANVHGPTLEVTTSFNNQQLFTCCWNPETIVQYIFDCSLNRLAKQIFLEPQFKNLRQIQLTAHPKVGFRREIVFYLKRKDWLAYHNSKKRNAKATLYRKMKITANGKPLEFNPLRAQDVE